MPEIGAVIAEGRTAEIYAWGEDHVLKLYRQGWDPQSAIYEHRLALASQQTGYRVPEVGDLIQIDGRSGIIYRRVEGRTMLQEMTAKPWKVFRFGRQQARLHAEMHTQNAQGFPPVIERLSYKIERAPLLEPQTKKKVLDHLAALPSDNKLLHGDFHPDNIMLTPDGPMIIDWIDAAAGHPLADVARTVVIGTVGFPPANLALAWFVKAFLGAYLPEYFEHSPFERSDLEDWILPVAAARLQENIPHEIKPLVQIVQRHLE